MENKMFNLDTSYLNIGINKIVCADNDAIEEELYAALDRQREIGYVAFKEEVLGELEFERCEIENDYVPDDECLINAIVIKCVALNDNLPIVNEALDWESSFANESVAA